VTTKPLVPHFQAYTLIERAVEEGAAIGWRRAFKYTETPTDEEAAATIASEVMNALCEVLNFNEGCGCGG